MSLLEMAHAQKLNLGSDPLWPTGVIEAIQNVCYFTRRTLLKSLESLDFKAPKLSKGSSGNFIFPFQAGRTTATLPLIPSTTTADIGNASRTGPCSTRGSSLPTPRCPASGSLSAGMSFDPLTDRIFR